MTVQLSIKMTKTFSKLPEHRTSVPSDVLIRLFRLGLSVRSVTQQLQQQGYKVSKSTVQNLKTELARQAGSDACSPQRSNKILSPRVNRTISRMIRFEGCRSKMQVCKKLQRRGYKVSYRTVRRILSAMQCIRFVRPNMKVFMTAKHRHLRLEWAKQQLQSCTDWSKVFFMDEKQWKLDGPEYRGKVLYDIRDPRPVLPRKGARNTAVQVWGAFSLTAVPQLAPISTHFDSCEYVKLLAARFLSYTHTPVPLLLHDRHPAHGSNETQKWLDCLGIQVVKLPPKSPDLNPIENVWSMVSRHVYAGMKTYTTKDSLLDAVRAAWELVRSDHSLRHRLVASMTDRLQAVVRQKGGPTEF